MENLISVAGGEAHLCTEDHWALAEMQGPAEEQAEPIVSTPYLIVTLDQWRHAWQTSDPRIANAELGILIAPDDDPAILTPWLKALPLIALQFASFSDGRAYSQAMMLRNRYGFEGDIRALGDVLRDQLALMRHCGFTSFAVRADKPASEAIKGLSGYDQIYARTAVNPEPLFRRRQRAGA
ncbi:uncharacterized protein (DUF934 family) [Marinobacterium sp. MBR-111]|jgi:uncharacterized protein (DUF934 family)|uniref:DUF934 domain-containing protein n=1 Tax=Marinobacterium sp. MBR-111 TaxID=3156463 RepID=UPI00339501CB